ncbi:oxygen-independent coproporphyrinogen III oxidase [Oceanicaulis alexandrii]|uniref:oxygen-independent coproporphyrinogen III oxidase n=1 Tax=Oceanicaulis alexandrii TaxID=153233 RepID=UPI0035D0DF91
MASRINTLLRYGQQRSPRYTSYPTAPHFHAGVDAAVYGDWLDTLDRGKPISLYLHVPYCKSLCWYCGCNTRATTQDGPVEAYLKVLLKELTLVADRLPGRMTVSHLALGGGTPAILNPSQMDRLMSAIRDRFDFVADAELAIEIDPRHFTRDDAKCLARNGFTRASTGVQSFDPAVQRAINRIQPYELVEAAFNRLREAGVMKINADLLYGLPLQTEDSARASAEAAAALNPDRLAVFGYAHVPHMKSHQRLIKDEDLPAAKARLKQADAMEAALIECGYALIGIDHYARPDDPMTRALETGTLRRNFQGYTTDKAETLIALGASAIGQTPQGHVQNKADVRNWMLDVDAGRLPVGKGVAVSREDAMRAAIIEQVMTYLSVDPDAVAACYGLPAPQADLEGLIASGVVTIESGRILVNPAYRPLARLVAAAFDGYLATSEARHSVSV